jgi:hypothetical protein
LLFKSNQNRNGNDDDDFWLAAIFFGVALEQAAVQDHEKILLQVSDYYLLRRCSNIDFTSFLGG